MSAVDILKKYSIKQKLIRTEILDILIKSRSSLSSSEIRSIITIPTDKVTVFRILNLFIKAGFVHLGHSTKPAMKYFFCENPSNTFVNFYCIKCNQTFSLNVPSVSIAKKPKGFNACKIYFSVKGICGNCV